MRAYSCSLVLCCAILAAARPTAARSKRHKVRQHDAATQIVCVCDFARLAQYDRFWKARKRDCERDMCGHMIPEEAYNCVNECTSSVCYGEVYAGEPLEDGARARSTE